MDGALIWFILVLAGFIAGFASSLFGVGGGIIMTPVLHYILHWPWHEAVTLSLAVITVQAPIGIWRHHTRKSVSMRLAWPIILGGIVGVLLGIALIPRIGIPWLKITFALLMIFAATRLIHPNVEARLDHPHWIILLLLGIGAGLISRLLGIGGGILTVPALALMGVPVHLAVGSSLVPVWTNAAAATILSAIHGIAWTAAIPFIAGAIPGALLGVRAAHALPELQLRRIFSGALLLAALYITATSGAW